MFGIQFSEPFYRSPNLQEKNFPYSLKNYSYCVKWLYVKEDLCATFLISLITLPPHVPLSSVISFRYGQYLTHWRHNADTAVPYTTVTRHSRTPSSSLPFKSPSRTAEEPDGGVLNNTLHIVRDLYDRLGNAEIKDATALDPTLHHLETIV